MKAITAILSAVVLLIPRLAQSQERLAILPLSGNGIADADLQTVYLLLQSELRQSGKYELLDEGVIRPLVPETGCAASVCAVEVGTQAGATRAVYGSLNKLGEKIIYQYGLVDVATQQVLIADQMTAYRVEDLDQVVKRVTISIMQLTPADKTVEVGLVTEQESIDPNTRKVSSSWGIGFGYLYPSEGYSNERNVFVWDFRSLYEFRRFAVDALLGARKGFAINVGMLYLPGPKDFSPFFGGGVGFHAVDHDDEFYYEPDVAEDIQDQIESDGIEFLIKAGVIGFRTYDFRLIATFEYSITMNDFDDRGAVVTIGVMRAGKRIFGIF